MFRFHLRTCPARDGRQDGRDFALDLEEHPTERPRQLNDAADDGTSWLINDE
ncbi:hypothetical protein [Streptosporangium sp. NPDC087985]|uniref:hypothetical protein n=1 Tax=Streptosporangium sp. NPDC087985 TaxID=3366196 RepID=UPI00382AE0BA